METGGSSCMGRRDVYGYHGLILALALLFSPSLAFSGALSGEAVVAVASGEIRSMTTGPAAGDIALRLSLVLSEVYFSVIIEEIYRDPAKEGEPSVESAHILTGRELSQQIGTTKLTELHFVRWVSASEAKLRNGDVQFIIERLSRGKYDVRRSSAP